MKISKHVLSFTYKIECIWLHNKMKKNKRITKYPKDKNSTTPGEDSSEE